MLLRMFAVLACVVSIDVASAASLSASTGGVAAARVSVPRCTAAGLPVTPTLSGSSIVGVAVAGLPSSCGGATLLAAVNNGSTSSTGSAAVPAGGGAVSVTLGAAVALAGADQIDVIVSGP